MRSHYNSQHDWYAFHEDRSIVAHVRIRDAESTYHDRLDMTALPYGINTPAGFLTVYMVMLPICFKCVPCRPNARLIRPAQKAIDARPRARMRTPRGLRTDSL